MSDLIHKIFNNRLPIADSNRFKSIACLFKGALSLSILLLFHTQLTNLLITLIAPDLSIGHGLSAENLFLRYQNVVIYGGTGIIFFYLLSSIEYFVLSVKLTVIKYKTYCRLILRLIRWATFLVFIDIALQNIGKGHTTLLNFSIQYQTIGAILAIELYILIDFFKTIKKTD